MFEDLLEYGMIRYLEIRPRSPSNMLSIVFPEYPPRST